MNISFKIEKLVTDLFNKNEILGATQIAELLGISRTIVHLVLKKLVDNKKIRKIGKGSHTKYKSRLINIDGEDKTKNSEDNKYEYTVDFKTEKLFNELFYKFTPQGNILKGFSGFKDWCNSRNLDTSEKVKNFLSIYNHIDKIQDLCGLLNAKEIFGKYFEDVYLDNIYYADQYKWMEFGRGKLAEMTFYAKQSQNKKLILESIDEITLKLKCIIKKEKFDGIAIVPWSINRQNQLLGILKDELKYLDIPFINIIKYYPNDIAIPQKSLKTREQRIQNARNTIFVNDKKISAYKKVFLIDDFVGSGSTLNETAFKLKQEGVKQIYGFAFVGNMNLDYEVINEV